MSQDRSNYKDGTQRPITATSYLHGVSVVDIGDLRVARGKTRHQYHDCKHQQLVYCNQERAVWCDDCETRLDLFDAFTRLVESADAIRKEINHLEKLKEETLISRASKAFDLEFRRKKSVPLCPHCYEAIFPEDVVKGLPTRSRSLAEQARKFKK